MKFPVLSEVGNDASDIEYCLTGGLKSSQERSALVVGNFLSSKNGIRGVCEELADRLHERGWNVLTVSAERNRLLRLVDMIRSAWTNRDRFRIAHVDVFSGAAFFWAEAVCWVLRRSGKPYVLTLHGGELPRFAKRWPRRITRLLTSASMVTVPSSYMLKQMRQFRQDMTLLPNALVISDYKFRPRLKVAPKLVWLRAFHRIYNPSLAAKVIALLVDELPDSKLLMIGPSKGDGSLESMMQVAANLGVMANITLPGRVPKEEVSDWLNEGDIFINTTSIDNTPISILEAMACGLCIVSTNVGGIPCVLEDEHDALLVAPDDPEAMAAAVRRILNDPTLAQQLSLNARKKVEQFDWSVILPRWEQLFASVMKEEDSNRVGSSSHSGSKSRSKKLKARCRS